MLAFLFKKEGGKIDKEDFIYSQSADLDWYPSKYARRVLERAQELSLVDVKDDLVIARFDFESVDIPMGFEPSTDILKEKKKDLFPELLDKVVEKSDLSKQEIMSLVNKKQDKMNIEVKTALLLVAQEKDVYLEERDKYIKEISKEIRGIN